MRNKILITTTILLGIILLAFIASLAINANKNQNFPSGHDCTPSSRNADACITIYKPVCGWFSDNIQCIKYPCAQTYSNSCEACKNSDVSHYTEGECPK
ncbi:hypothetical protein HY212_05280 [Candidatus Pacearchaeota archaeon]|nr:hypothetical protein [Candidatus Pacearchaeota archaeon]